MDAPRQNWELFGRRSRDEYEAWLRDLTPADGLALLESLRQFAAKLPGAPETVEVAAAAWNEKLAIRRKLREAFARFDQLQRDQRTSQDAH